MTGIVSYGAYIPYYRLSRKEIARAWGSAPQPGERSVSNFDEDTITMGTAAAFDCINGMDRGDIDGLYFASASSPYHEKLSAATIATALDLGPEVVVADFANSLRAGTNALRSAIDSVTAGSTDKVLIVASESRLGAPQSEFEMSFGDGAAALLVGRSDVAVEIEGSFTVFDEFMDIWRTDRDTFCRSWESRFVISEGYEKNMRRAVSGVMNKCHLNAKDIAKVVLYAPNARSHAALGKKLGFDVKRQLQDPLLKDVGNTGSASAFMILVAALEEALPGDRILMASYGDGVDAFILRVTEDVKGLKDRRGISWHLERKGLLTNYEKYIRFRNLMPMEGSRRRLPPGSVSRNWRDTQGAIRLHGVTCKACGLVQFPPTRICLKCRSKDEMETIRLSDKRATVFTYSLDRLTASPDPPAINTAINFEDGGRMFCLLTDCNPDEVKIGMPVEMTFRCMHKGGGFNNYYWKAKPAG